MEELLKALIGSPWVRVLEPLAYLATICAVPWALWIYARDVRRQREEREVGTYSSLDDKYLHYLELCLQHPQLNIFVLPTRAGGGYTAEQMIQRYALFETIVSIMERAFLRYRDHPSARRRDQWPGWEGYLRDWKAHPDFNVLWGVVGRQFDQTFTKFVDDLSPSDHPPAMVVGTATVPAMPTPAMPVQAAAAVPAQAATG